MNFLALLLGLGVERLLTHLFHLRQFDWLDPYFDRVFAKLARTSRGVAAAGVVAAVLLAALPVIVAAYVLEGTLADIPYFLFAVVVLLFSLGPRDLLDEGANFVAAMNRGDLEQARKLSRELVENCGDTDGLGRVDQAVYVQANNRVFSVAFWFVVLGPAGAWLFRSVDLMRHRATCELPRLSHETTQRVTAEPIDGASQSIYYLHGALAWLPSRLLIVGYMLAGSFDGALAGFRRYYSQPAIHVSHLSDEVLAFVGRGASGQLALTEDADLPVANDDPLVLSNVAEQAAVAVSLVRRTLWLIWCPALALLTLTDGLL